MSVAYPVDSGEVLVVNERETVILEASFDWFLGGKRLPNT
jgi:hypothetical protein